MTSALLLQEPQVNGGVLRYFVYFLLGQSLSPLFPPSHHDAHCSLNSGILGNAGVFLPNCVHRVGSNLFGFKIGHIHSFAQNHRHSSGFECCYGQLTVSLIFTFFMCFPFSSSMFRGFLPYPWGLVIRQDMSWFDLGMYFDFSQVAVSGFHLGSLSSVCLWMVCALE